MPSDAYRRWGKRGLDLLLAALGLALLAPLLAAIAAALKLLDPGPVLFAQTRVGRGFKPFRILKFRSMRCGEPGPQVTRAGDARITPLGRLLRATKLDELPQLVNVLRGEMSLVGPRPEVPRYVERFRAEYAEVLSVAPGITDYAAIEFRREEELLAQSADPEEAYLRDVLPRKLALYRRYVADVSLATDLRLLASTLARVLAEPGRTGALLLRRPSAPPKPALPAPRAVTGP